MCLISSWLHLGHSCVCKNEEATVMDTVSNLGKVTRLLLKRADSIRKIVF